MEFHKQALWLSLLLVILSFACREEDDQIETANTNPSTPANKDQFTDSRDGNVYSWVQIGDQIWMAENLRYLPEVIEPDSGSFSQAYYYVYGYNGSDLIAAKAHPNYQTYGVLYNWSAATLGGAVVSEIPDRIQGVCPDGWHLPTDAEWTQLTDFLGGRDVSGGKIKSTDSTLWQDPNVGATNETGFNALPSGLRASNGSFSDLGLSAYFWSSTENGSMSSWFRNVYYNNGQVYRIDFFKDSGFCVRCIKD